MKRPTAQRLVCAAVAAVFISTSWAADTPAIDEALRDELGRRFKVDQEARAAAIDLMKTRGSTDLTKIKDKESEAALKKLKEIDKANREWLKGVVDNRGWPGKSLVGADGAHKAWLLVQHCDDDRAFQKKCLDLMKPLAEKGEVAKVDVAYLTDRVLVGENKNQIYGTQFHQVNGKLEPQPIEDEANVDARRKEAGMPPLAEYRKMMEERYLKKK